MQFAKAKYGKDHASLAILHASFSIHVHRDCQRARMQLQQVQRNNMGIMEVGDDSSRLLLCCAI